MRIIPLYIDIYTCLTRMVRRFTRLVETASNCRVNDPGPITDRLRKHSGRTASRGNIYAQSASGTCARTTYPYVSNAPANHGRWRPKLAITQGANLKSHQILVDRKRKPAGSPTASARQTITSPTLHNIRRRTSFESPYGSRVTPHDHLRSACIYAERSFSRIDRLNVNPLIPLAYV